jgi:transposase-like protein
VLQLSRQVPLAGLPASSFESCRYYRAAIDPQLLSGTGDVAAGTGKRLPHCLARHLCEAAGTLAGFEVAREAGLHVSQLFRWRKELCKRGEASVAALVPVAIVASPPRQAEEPSSTTAPAQRSGSQGIIEIELGSGHRGSIVTWTGMAAFLEAVRKLSTADAMGGG